MNPPKRWRDDPSAPEDLRDLLRHAPRSHPMPSHLRVQSARRIDRLIVVPAAAGILFWIKGVALAGFCAVGAVAVARLVPVRSDAPVHSIHAVSSVTARPVQAEPRVDLAPAQEITVPEPVVSPPALSAGLAPEVKRPPAAPNTSIAPDPRPVDSLAREAAILEGARELLGRRPDQALAALDRYAADFPDGRLKMERDLLELAALRRLGRAAEARRHGQDLLERARGSIYEAHVKSILDALPASP